MDPKDTADAAVLREFARFPTRSAVWLGLIGVSGVVYGVTLGLDPTRITPLAIGSAAVLVSLRYQWGLVRAWRRDIRLAELVADDEPECACAGPTVYYGGQVSCLAVASGVIAWLVMTPSVIKSAEGAPWGLITIVVVGIVAFSLLVGVNWRGHDYVAVNPDGIRTIHRGRFNSAPWERTRYWGHGVVGVEGSADRVTVGGETERIIRERSDAAALATFTERLRAGDTVDLGGAELTPTELCLDSGSVEWDQLGAVRLEHDSENNWTHVVAFDKALKRRGKSMKGEIANYAAFEAVLREHAGVGIFDPRR